MSSETHRSGPRPRARSISGILVLDKPWGMSSNQALQRVKRLFNAQKAGHTGNLDVRATGVLPICFGEATKLSQFLLDADKHYQAEITFGARTSTGDSEGEVVASGAVDQLDSDTLRAAMAGFEGPGTQVPPMYSALKRDGQPLYKLARQGIEVAREEREVVIHRFELLEFDTPVARVDIRCSKGTYVRTLAEDLALAVGSEAHVTGLRRHGAAPFLLEQAVSLETLERLLNEDGSAAIDAMLRPTDSALPHLPAQTLSGDETHSLRCGQQPRLKTPPAGGLLKLYDQNGVFVGIGEAAPDGRLCSRRLMQSEKTPENLHTGSNRPLMAAARRA